MKIKLTGIYSKIVYVSVILIILAQITLVAENKKYDKYGIINGKNVHLKDLPSGTTIDALKEGEVVFIIKKENNKTKNDYWYQVVKFNGKTGWVNEESIYYLDENKIPENYYIQILKLNIKDSEGFSLYNSKFEYYKDYNLISYRFFKVDPPVGFESLKIYEVKDKKARMITSQHKYYDQTFIDDRYVFFIGGSRITVYDRNQLDEMETYTRVKDLHITGNYYIIRNESILDFNKSDNCYYLKFKVKDKITREIQEETYKFDGEKLVKVQ